jgi:hypothetical protein
MNGAGNRTFSLPLLASIRLATIQRVLEGPFYLFGSAAAREFRNDLSCNQMEC